VRRSAGNLGAPPSGGCPGGVVRIGIARNVHDGSAADPAAVRGATRPPMSAKREQLPANG